MLLPLTKPQNLKPDNDSFSKDSDPQLMFAQD
jgi:hypothetical protein